MIKFILVGLFFFSLGIFVSLYVAASAAHHLYGDNAVTKVQELREMLEDKSVP